LWEKKLESVEDENCSDGRKDTPVCKKVVIEDVISCVEDKKS